MAGNAGDIPSEKFLHLALGQPHRFIFERHIQRHGTVRSLINDNLVLKIAGILHDHLGVIFGIFLRLRRFLLRFLEGIFIRSGNGKRFLCDYVHVFKIVRHILKAARHVLKIVGHILKAVISGTFYMAGIDLAGLVKIIMHIRMSLS